MGQHKYFWWSDGSFTGFGSTESESGPGADQCEVYWVNEKTETKMKRLAKQKKDAFEKANLPSPTGIYVPFVNDCHNLVDDTLRECDLPPTSLGRFSGESEAVYSSLEESCTIV